MTTVHLLQAFPEVAEHYRRRFRHVLVDEYQDTNHAQYVLVRELVGTRHAAPSTASWWAGASTPGPPGRALRRGRRRPVHLRLPRRDDPQHPAVRGRLPRRPGDPPRAELPVHPDHPLRGQRRHLAQPRSQAQAAVDRQRRRSEDRRLRRRRRAREAQFVAEEIDRLGDEGLAKPGDVAVFYRTNAQSRVLEEVFIRVGLPYRVVGGVRFYERREIRDALAYLRTLANPDDSVSLRRILNVPSRGIGDRAEAASRRWHSARAITFWQALRRAADAPGIATRSARASSRSSRSSTDSAPSSPTAPRRRRSSRRFSTAPATWPSWPPRTTRRTRPGPTTFASWSRSPASSSRRRSTTTAACSRPSSSRSAWLPTPTTSPKARTTAGWSR